MSVGKPCHSGHRDRMKKKFRDFGLDVFAEHEVLELLLYYAIPRANVNEQAHKLIEKFGSLTEVIDAPYCSLKNIEGIGENAATLISLISQIERRLAMSRSGKLGGARIRNSKDAGRLLAPYFTGAVCEMIYLMTLTAAGSTIKCRKLQDGNVSDVFFDFRKLVSAALEDNAAAVIIAHNHLSGVALPSKTDIAVTAKISEILKHIGVNLADHIIVADGDWVSFKDSNLM